MRVTHAERAGSLWCGIRVCTYACWECSLRLRTAHRSNSAKNNKRDHSTYGIFREDQHTVHGVLRFLIGR